MPQKFKISHDKLIQQWSEETKQTLFKNSNKKNQRFLIAN